MGFFLRCESKKHLKSKDKDMKPSSHVWDFTMHQWSEHSLTIFNYMSIYAYIHVWDFTTHQWSEHPLTVFNHMSIYIYIYIYILSSFLFYHSMYPNKIYCHLILICFQIQYIIIYWVYLSNITNLSYICQFVH